MLYMVVERFRPGAAAAVYERVARRGRMIPEGLVYVDSWVSTDLSVCYQLMRTEEPALLDSWMSCWSDLVEFEVRRVVSSAEAASAAAGPQGGA